MSQRITKVFKSGNSQAVRLPRDFRMDSDKVVIRKAGKNIIISPLPTSWKGFMDNTSPLSEDFSIEGAQLPDDVPRASLKN